MTNLQVFYSKFEYYYLKLQYQILITKLRSHRQHMLFYTHKFNIKSDKETQLYINHAVLIEFNNHFISINKLSISLL